MNDDKRKIVCPTCKTVLEVGYFPGIESKSFACPNCKTQHAFTEYLPYVAANWRTARGNASGEDTIPGGQGKANSEDTPIAGGSNSVIGRLQMAGQAGLVTLRQGRNTIGRKADSSDATIQVPDESRKMSRVHFVIDVTCKPGKGVFHTVSLAPGKKNASFLNGEPMEADDRFVLMDGDTLRVAGVKLTFVLPDEEGTL
ncbi:MAG: FHA domain-containing protein [Bacteroidales bacterium]|nr:FHA domain-containing protein [Bacteroidales bacterium]